MFESWLLTAGTILFSIGLLFELAFDFDYGLTQPWWTNRVGRMFMLNSLAIVFAGISILLGRIFGPVYHGRPLVTLLTFGIFAASCALRYKVYLAERGQPIGELPAPNSAEMIHGPRRLTRREQRARTRDYLQERKSRRDS